MNLREKIVQAKREEAERVRKQKEEQRAEEERLRRWYVNPDRFRGELNAIFDGATVYLDVLSADASGQRLCERSTGMILLVEEERHYLENAGLSSWVAVYAEGVAPRRGQRAVTDFEKRYMSLRNIHDVALALDKLDGETQ